MLKNSPDMIPGQTWGSMNSQEEKDIWGENNCDDIVGGSSKENCAGSCQTLCLKHFYCFIFTNFENKSLENQNNFFVSLKIS